MAASPLDTDETNTDMKLGFDAEALRDVNLSLNREWLVTNGLGGYAAATLATANTRRYHGLLVAALNPPVGRAVLLSKLEETLTVAAADGTTTAYELSANVYPGTIHPQGYTLLQSWRALPVPTWAWELAPGLMFEKRVWMPQGQNTTYIAYRLLAAPDNANVRLSLVPLLAWRDYHSEMAACDTHIPAEWSNATLALTLPPIQQIRFETTFLQLILRDENGSPFPNADFAPHPDWYRAFQQPREQERGLEHQEDLYAPGTLSLSLAPGQTLVVAAGTEQHVPIPQIEEERIRTAKDAKQDEKKIEDKSQNSEEAQSEIANLKSPIANPVALLTRAASQFVVQVPGIRASVIAGYPWFGDWGRDTMIALPGLCLTTGRFEVAREILLSFAQYVDKGMLPNRFPDAGAAPEYNTVDATLWYFIAIYRYVEATNDLAVLKNGLWDVLKQIVAWHVGGTRYNIHVDKADGLLYAGEAGVQLTWMDAKVGDWVVTPRIGKPVEINALWYAALRIMAHFAGLLNDSTADSYTQQAQIAQAGFLRSFARADGQGLYDVIDTPEGSDTSIRPNQIFALSLPFAVVEANTDLAAAVVNVVQEELLTPCGLRTLSPRDPAYQPRYEGDPLHRDGAYHQGTVWPWLLGSFVETYDKVTNDREGAKAMLNTLLSQMTTFCVGSLAEVFDGSEPQRPNGCFAQAWSIAETLRVWQQLTTA